MATQQRRRPARAPQTPQNSTQLGVILVVVAVVVALLLFTVGGGSDSSDDDLTAADQVQQGATTTSTPEVETPQAFVGLGALGSRPNPTSGPATIEWSAAAAGSGDLEVYAVSGRRIRSMPVSWDASGRGSTQWDGRDQHGDLVPSGVYQLRLSSTGGNASSGIATGGDATSGTATGATSGSVIVRR